MGWIFCARREKSRRDFVARAFALIALVHPVFTEFHAVMKRSQMTQTLWNEPEPEFRFQWGGSSALIAKNYNTTSWHKLLH